MRLGEQGWFEFCIYLSIRSTLFYFQNNTNIIFCTIVKTLHLCCHPNASFVLSSQYLVFDKLPKQNPIYWRIDACLSLQTNVVRRLGIPSHFASPRAECKPTGPIGAAMMRWRWVRSWVRRWVRRLDLVRWLQTCEQIYKETTIFEAMALRQIVYIEYRYILINAILGFMRKCFRFSWGKFESDILQEGIYQPRYRITS